MWYGNNEGNFKVKDAYRIARAFKDHASYSNRADPMWKKLWKLNIPPKAKVFLWRAVRDIIPHNANLHKKRVLDSPKCPRCGVLESSIHVFRDCSWARKLWSLAPIAIYKQEALDIRTWFTEILDNSPPYDSDLFATLLWQIWYSRNELCFEKIYSSPDISFKRAKDILCDYQRWNGSKNQSKPHRDRAK